MEELKKLGYEIRNGKLMQVGSDKGFEFRDQVHYDALADSVLRYVGTLLVEEAKLQPVPLPLDGTGPKTTVFVSDGWQTASKLLLLIQGSGRVRVGVWGCALCINKDLDWGTMLPYLRVAAERGYGVIVLNPNENQVDGIPIKGSESPDNHLAYVWEHLVSQNTAAKEVDIIAHSNGGRLLLAFLGRATGAGPAPEVAVAQNAAERIRRIVFTDSYHDSTQVDLLTPELQALMENESRVVNYVPHAAPIGSPVKTWISLGHHFTQESKRCLCLSVAVEDHAATNHASLDVAFRFLEVS
eukprot:TRINITY_DN3834_c3_g1_i1.p1 TRINITY_DN3834_c3_g1~~TRINITY_DN3834_c3_g1_i1.p1  ORF type:complete len:298 (+),score=32.34 TRINITY_DN3834_c3_g1_i1:117-1010(+)